MTWYTLDLPSTPWTDADAASTTWRSTPATSIEWEDVAMGEARLYDVTGDPLYDSTGDILEAADE